MITVRHHKACRVMLKLFEWQNFQYAPKNHYGFFFLHTLPSTIAFRLENVLFYQFYAKKTTFFDQEKFGIAPLLYVDVEVETFGGNWHEKWCQNVKIIILTSYTSVVLYPSSKITFSSPGQVHGNPGQVCKQVAQRATIAHLSPMCQGQSAPKPYAAFPPPQWCYT